MISISRRLERWIIRAFDLLPKPLSFRALAIYLFTSPYIFLKLARSTVRGKARHVLSKERPKVVSSRPAKRETTSGKSGDTVCVRYSGGVDSTLNAAAMAERFKDVHLLTFNTSFRYFSFGVIRSDPSNARVNAQIIRRTFPNVSFRHVTLDNHALRNEIYFTDYQKRFQAPDHLRVLLCPACVMSMHVQTAAYCIGHKIRFVSDGAASEGNRRLWQTQHEANLRFVEGFYASCGITYIKNPHYAVRNADERLGAFGGLEDFPDSGYYPYRRKTQQFCIPIHLHSVCRRLHGHVPSEEEGELGAGIMAEAFEPVVLRYTAMSKEMAEGIEARCRLVA
jgi:hypothetical protein